MTTITGCLSEIIAHLRVAQVQRLPTDDAIIAGHIDAAMAIARVAADPCAWCQERVATRWVHDRAMIADSANARICDDCADAEGERQIERRAA